MRSHLIALFATLAVVTWFGATQTCNAQDDKNPAQARPATPQPDKPAQPAKPQDAKPEAARPVLPPAAAAVVEVQAVPQRANVAMPAMRLIPAMGRALPNPTGLPFDLSNLVLAKFDESAKGPQLVALVEQSRTEQRTVPVTRVRQEVKTRKVKVTDKDGKESEVDQEYTVSVAFTENVDQMVQVPAGKKPTAFPLGELRIYRLDGTKVTEAEARKQLEKMSPIFLLRGFTGDVKAVEGVYSQALNPNCLIVVTEKAE